MTMLEDQSRVRTPNSALVLGMIRRVVLSLSNAAVDKARKANPKSKFNTKSFRQRFLAARGGPETRYLPRLTSRTAHGRSDDRR